METRVSLALAKRIKDKDYILVKLNTYQVITKTYLNTEDSKQDIIQICQDQTGYSLKVEDLIDLGTYTQDSGVDITELYYEDVTNLKTDKDLSEEFSWYSLSYLLSMNVSGQVNVLMSIFRMNDWYQMPV